MLFFGFQNYSNQSLICVSADCLLSEDSQLSEKVNLHEVDWTEQPIHQHLYDLHDAEAEPEADSAAQVRQVGWPVEGREQRPVEDDVLVYGDCQGTPVSRRHLFRDFIGCNPGLQT